ncbi:MAG: hypothetical protein PF518_10075 [Spirochaetaceae bacterium]|jgi:hypothetical protein|nr:hypothetical protein [Spirochaetaceae bacterium]
MKKVLLIAVALMLTTTLFANEGKFKAGVSLGYPTGLTVGWHPSEKFELNLLLGTDYTGFTVGITPLFTLTNLDISDNNFPLSIGPSVNFSFAQYVTAIDILGLIRMEYNFKDIPLNAYVEFGAGVRITSVTIPAFWTIPETTVSTTGFGWSSALGVRYVF